MISASVVTSASQGFGCGAEAEAKAQRAAIEGVGQIAGPSHEGRPEDHQQDRCHEGRAWRLLEQGRLRDLTGHGPSAVGALVREARGDP